MVIKIGKFVHTGIIVKNLEEALKTYSKFFGKKLGEGEVDHRGMKMKEGELIEVKDKTGGLRTKVAVINVGDKTFEFLQPVSKGWLSKILSERGEGIYHVAYAVDNLEESIIEFEKMGIIHDGIAPRHKEIIYLKTSEGMYIELIDITKERKRTGNIMSYY
jgi:methylmalonyl-CoA/ethylmalonyl-CoA epimerase